MKVIEKEFRGFRQWLITNEHQLSPRASVIVSDLKLLDGVAQNMSIYRGIDSPFITIFRELCDAENYGKQGQKEVAKSVIEQIREIDEYAFKHDIEFRKQIQSKRKATCETAFRYYLKFLCEMFGYFTMDDLYNAKAITQQRRTHNRTFKSMQKYSAKDYKQGIVSLLEKSGAIFKKSNKIIEITLVDLEDILNAYAELHNGRPQNILKATSFLLSTNDGYFDWHDIIAENLSIQNCGEVIRIRSHQEVKLDIEHLTMTIIDFDRERVYPLPLLSDRPGKSRIIRAETTYTAGLRNQSIALDKLRTVSLQLRQNIDKYNELLALDNENQMPQCNDLLFGSIFPYGDILFSELEKYASNLKVELYVE